MPTVTDENGELVDLTFKGDNQHLVAAFRWEVGHTYQLEFDSGKATSVVVRLPQSAEGKESDKTGGSLWRQDPAIGNWNPAVNHSKTVVTSSGLNHIYEVQSGWGIDRLRLLFTPGTSDRWFEVRKG